jgi:ribonuclease BN (tRNA processing enzyme)
MSQFMSTVWLLPLGVGDAFSARNYTSCLALGVDDQWLLIDCPHPVRKMLREGSVIAGLSRPLDIDQICAAAVTHLHADHSCGLEDFGYYSFFALGRRATLLMHPDASARLWNGLLAAGMEFIQSNSEAPPVQKQLSDYFELTDLHLNRPVQCGPFSIECRRTIHGVPTFAFRITMGGRTVGFSADTAYDPSLIEWLNASDLIVHEVTTLVHTGVHTPYEKLAALPEAIRSKMRLTHYPDDFDLDSSVIEPLRQGSLIWV